MNNTIFSWTAALAAAALLAGCTGKENPDPRPAAFSDPAPEVRTEDLAPNHLALARDLTDKQYYEVALGQLKIAMDKGSRDAAVYDLAGVCARELRDYTAGETYFKKALDLAPDNASAYNNIGILYAETGKNRLAEQHLTRAVQTDPGRADYLNNLGYLFLSRKQYRQAELTFQKALDLSPGYEPAANNLAVSLGLQHKDDQAMAVLRSVHDPETARHNMARIRAMAAPNRTSGIPAAMAVQKEAGRTSVQPVGISGDAANLIYTKKYLPAMQADPDSIASGGGE